MLTNTPNREVNMETTYSTGEGNAEASFRDRSGIIRATRESAKVFFQLALLPLESRISKMVSTNRLEILVKFLDERHSRWNIGAHDLLRWDILQVFHQGSQAIPDTIATQRETLRGGARIQ